MRIVLASSTGILCTGLFCVICSPSRMKTQRRLRLLPPLASCEHPWDLGVISWRSNFMLLKSGNFLSLSSQDFSVSSACPAGWTQRWLCLLWPSHVVSYSQLFITECAVWLGENLILLTPCSHVLQVWFLELSERKISNKRAVKASSECSFAVLTLREPEQHPEVEPWTLVARLIMSLAKKVVKPSSESPVHISQPWTFAMRPSSVHSVGEMLVR